MNRWRTLKSLTMRSTSSSVGHIGSDFYIQIIEKYRIFRKSSKLPALIFLRFATRTINRITNVTYGDWISNYFRGYFNIYLKLFGLEKTALSQSSRSQKLYLRTDYREKILEFAKEVFLTSPATYTVSWRNKTAETLRHNFSQLPIFRSESSHYESSFKNALIYSLKLPRFYLIARSASGDLSSINPAATGCLGRVFNGGMTGSKTNTIIHFLLPWHEDKTSRNVEMPPFHQNMVIKNASYRNIFLYDQRTGGSRVFPLSYLRTWQASMASNIRKAGSKIYRAVHPLPAKYGNERYPADALTINVQNGNQKVISDILRRADMPSFRENMAAKNTNYENIFLYDQRTGGSRVFPLSYLGTWQASMISNIWRADSKIYRAVRPLPFKYGDEEYSFNASTVNIQNKSQKIIYSIAGKAYIPSVLRERAPKEVNYGTIFLYDQRTGGSRVFPLSYLRAWQASMASNTWNTDSMINRAVHSLLSRLKQVDGLSTDNATISKNAGSITLQHGMVIKNLSYIAGEKQISVRKNLTNIFIRRNILIRIPHTSSGMVFPGSSDFQYAESTKGKMNQISSNALTGNRTNNSAELILKKPVVPETGIILENKETLRTGKTEPVKTYDDLIKETVKEKSIAEISLIADRVYKMIEKRISIEKDRRGLF